MMDRIDEFIIDRIMNKSLSIKTLFEENGFSQEIVIINSNSNLDNLQDEFIDTICDLVSNYLLDIRDSTHNEVLDEWFVGGDESIFENGHYCYEYHEFEGWFYYLSPECEVHGLHKVGDTFVL